MALQLLTVSSKYDINTLREYSMAYNFRPKNTAEITGKKKKFSIQVADVYTFIKKEYGETIVLDPTSNFQKVKVPRIVEKTDGIAALKKKLAAKANTAGLDISFGNGSGTGGSTINAVETAKQENATRFVCEQFIDKTPNQMPSGDKIAAIYENYDDDWHATFKLQAEKLKSWLGTNKGYEYSRDDGIMPFVERVAQQKCGVSTKDSWNPADIYIVRKTKRREIEAEITKIGDMPGTAPQRLDMLNEYMRKQFKTRDLVGISLKKLGRTATVEETNINRQQTLKEIKIIPNSMKLDLDLAANGEFVTGEFKFQIEAEGNVVNVQVRAFSGGIREKTQMDMTAAGAAAKLGKVSVIEAINPFLNSMSPQQKLRSGTDLPKVGAFTDADIKKYVDEQNALKRVTIGGSGPIDFGRNDFKTTLMEAIQLEQDNNRTASQLSAKLQCFEWIRILKAAEQQNKLKDFLSVLYYGAKKQYATAGPFLKIS